MIHISSQLSTLTATLLLPQTAIHAFIVIGSFLMYFLVSLLYNGVCVTCNSPTNPYWDMQRQLADPIFYLVCFLTPAVALLPRFEHCDYYLFSNLQSSLDETIFCKPRGY